MKLFNPLKISLITSVLAFSLFAQLHGQDKAAAIKAFNKGLELAKANNYGEAITSFEKVYEIAEQIGDEDLKSRASKQLPTMYYQKAVTTYKQFQSDKDPATLRKAISEFHIAADEAEKYENNQIVNKSRGISTQLTYNLSVQYFKQDKLDSAQAAVNRAINSNSNYAKAYYHKALVEKKMGSFDSFLNMIDQAINIGLANNDQELVEKAEEKASAELVVKGVKASENKNFDQAENLLNRALEYNDSNSNAHYRLAELANKRGNRNVALTHARKALELETGGKTDTAKIYFELGLAHQGLGNKEAACSALKNAAYGSFKANAEHKMEFELKCETVAQSK